MDDRERLEKSKAVHILMALRRKKENRQVQELCFRQVVRDEEVDLRILRERIKDIEGVWRIYHTVNRRDVDKALKLLMKHMIDRPEDAYRLTSIWKTCLMKPTSKYEKNFLIDIDSESKDLRDEVLEGLKTSEIKIFKRIRTPNGFHIVTEKFDTRLLVHLRPTVEIHRDRYYFVKKFTIKKKIVGNCPECDGRGSYTETSYEDGGKVDFTGVCPLCRGTKNATLEDKKKWEDEIYERS